MDGRLGQTRRRFLRAGLGACAAFAALPACATNASRTLAFRNLHTDEHAAITYWADGAYLDDALREINWVLRDHRTNEMLPMDTALLDLLHRLKQRLDSDAAFHVISAYRSPATNAMLVQTGHGVVPMSLHTEGRAIDIRVPNRALATVRTAALHLEAGGVGYYPKGEFVHVDVGRVRVW